MLLITTGKGDLTIIHKTNAFSLIVSYGLHTSFINSLVQKNKNIHANPIKSLRFGLCHTFTPRPWKHGFAFTPQAWRYDTNQTLSIKIQLKRMIYLQQELGRAWVCFPPSTNPSGKANPGSPSLLKEVNTRALLRARPLNSCFLLRMALKMSPEYSSP